MKKVKFDENPEHLINFHNPNIWMGQVDGIRSYQKVKFDAPTIIGLISIIGIGFCIWAYLPK